MSPPFSQGLTPSILNVINMSLSTGVVPTSAVIKNLLKKKTSIQKSSKITDPSLTFHSFPKSLREPLHPNLPIIYLVIISMNPSNLASDHFTLSKRHLLKWTMVFCFPLTQTIPVWFIPGSLCSQVRHLVSMFSWTFWIQRTMKKSKKSFWLNMKSQPTPTEGGFVPLTSTKRKPHVSCTTTWKTCFISCRRWHYLIIKVINHWWLIILL